MLHETPETGIGLEINTQNTFLDLGRWTTILGVMCIVVMAGVSFILAILLFANAMDVAKLDDSYTTGAYVACMIMMCVVIGMNIYPIYALFKYSSGIKTAIATNDKQLFHTSVLYLRNFFRYIVVAAIVFVCLYVGFAMIFAMVSGLF